MHTTDDLCLDTRDVTPSKAFGLLKASVVPRPIAWTSTVSTDGVNNLAPFSFFTVVSSEPPMVLLSLEFLDGGRLKDSAANIEATGEFVVNIAPSTYASAVDLTSHFFDADVDEFSLAGLTPVPSLRVTAESGRRSADQPGMPAAHHASAGQRPTGHRRGRGIPRRTPCSRRGRPDRRRPIGSARSDRR